MLTLEILLAFTISAIVMSATPGPSNMYVMARTIEKGFVGGFEAALGLAVGCLIHVVAASLGLAALFKHSPEIYVGLKVVGALYLIYLGVSYWRTPAAVTSADKDSTKLSISSHSSQRMFLQSVIVEVTNPKTALFFIAFLPQFVTPEAGLVPVQLFVLGLIFTVVAFSSDLLVAAFSNTLSKWLIQNPQAQAMQDKICGGILVALGSLILVEETQHR